MQRPSNAKGLRSLTTNSARFLPFVVFVVALSGCGLLNDIEKLESFAFSEVEGGGPVTPGIDVAGLSRAIFLVGQVNTPNRCFALRAELEDNDRNLTLRVTARTNATNCAPEPGAFRYESAIRPLDPGSYDLRVIHSFPGTSQPTEEFSSDVVVR
jgi:hypothetical protein